MTSPAHGPAVSPVRSVLLLEGERVWHRFDPHRGLLEDAPENGPLLVLTSHRLITFSQNRGHAQTQMIALEDLHAASATRHSRRLAQLLRGLALVLLGVAVYLFVGLFVVTTGSALVPALIGGTVSVAGLLLVARYLLWEQQGVISFMAAHGGSLQLNFE